MFGVNGQNRIRLKLFAELSLTMVSGVKASTHSNSMKGVSSPYSVFHTNSSAHAGSRSQEAAVAGSCSTTEGELENQLTLGRARGFLEHKKNILGFILNL